MTVKAFIARKSFLLLFCKQLGRMLSSLLQSKSTSLGMMFGCYIHNRSFSPMQEGGLNLARIRVILAGNF